MHDQEPIRCEKCGKPYSYDCDDYCAHCSKNLCLDCMAVGCCGHVPADSGLTADMSDATFRPRNEATDKSST